MARKIQMKISAAHFRQILFQWYAVNKRDLPWRNTQNPYHIWVSEIMLQQTQVQRVKEFYKGFLKRFPGVKSLAEASWKEVLEYWRGLGYYRRARYLHESAKKIMEEYHGNLPCTFAEWQNLSGIGRYTAAAISSFAFQESVPAIDTNFETVMGHVFGEDFWVSLSPSEKFMFAQELIPKNKASDFNHAMMDVGSFLKSLKDHERCPFYGYCVGNIEKRKKVLPRFSRTQRYTNVAAGLLIHKGKVLITQRKKEGTLGGFWEFPGGKVEKGEDERTCLKREMKEELGIEVSVRPAFYSMVTEYDGQLFRVSFHRCSLLYGQPKPLQVNVFEWVAPEKLGQFNFLPDNRQVLELLQKKKAMFRV